MMKTIDQEQLAAAIEARAASDLAEGKISGASVLVSQHGAECYRAYFGTTVPCGDVPVSARTLYRMASMTKPISTAAALIAVERGLLSLSDKVSRYLPAYENMTVIDPKADGSYDTHLCEEPLTVWHLLTHTSGLANSRALPALSDLKAASLSLREYVDALATKPLAFTPATAAEYNATAAFDVLTVILEDVTGMDYLDYLTKEIFTPLGMRDTTFVPSEEQWARLITMHNRVDGKSVSSTRWAGCVFQNIPANRYLGGAGLVSSLDDYARFADMLRRGGNSESGRLLSESSVRMMAQVQTPIPIQTARQDPFTYSERWGLGVRIVAKEAYERLPVGAYGWSGAYGTHFFIDPVNDVVGIYLKNSAYDGGSGALTSANFECDVHDALI
ncbi:MAG: beta-lactamase family protein [Clostridia bacterium]|nr:beta-lactamase family protein [Clostridia bacterium]